MCEWVLCKFAYCILYTFVYLCHYQGGAAKNVNNIDGASSSTTTSSASASSSNTLVVTASTNTTTNSSSSSHSRVSPGAGGGGHQHHRQPRHSNTAAHTSHVYNRDKGHRDHGNKSKTKSTNKANSGSYIIFVMIS